MSPKARSAKGAPASSAGPAKVAITVAAVGAAATIGAAAIGLLKPDSGQAPPAAGSTTSETRPAPVPDPVRTLTIRGFRFSASGEVPKIIIVEGVADSAAPVRCFARPVDSDVRPGQPWYVSDVVIAAGDGTWRAIITLAAEETRALAVQAAVVFEPPEPDRAAEPAPTAGPPVSRPGTQPQAEPPEPELRLGPGRYAEVTPPTRVQPPP